MSKSKVEEKESRELFILMSGKHSSRDPETGELTVYWPGDKVRLSLGEQIAFGDKFCSEADFEDRWKNYLESKQRKAKIQAVEDEKKRAAAHEPKDRDEDATVRSERIELMKKKSGTVYPL